MRGHADACLSAIGVPGFTPDGVAGLYADFLDGWLVDKADEASMSTSDLAVRAIPLLMTDVDAS